LDEAIDHCLIAADRLITAELMWQQSRWPPGYLEMCVTETSVIRRGKTVLFQGKARLMDRALQLVRLLHQAGSNGKSIRELRDQMYGSGSEDESNLRRQKGNANKFLVELNVQIADKSKGIWWLCNVN
jgi:hypothetical protein